MAWNVWLAEWLMSSSPESVLLGFCAVLFLVVLALLGFVRMLDKLEEKDRDRDWIERATAQLLLDMQARLITRISFDFRSRGAAFVRINGPEIDFFWSSTEPLIPRPENLPVYGLFEYPRDRRTMARLMDELYRQAQNNRAWLGIHRERKFLEVLRSAEIYRFKKVA